MARLTKQELKKDELVAQLGVGLNYFMHHRRPLLKWIGIGGGVVVLALAVMLFLRSRNQNASEAFGKALDTYHATVTPTKAPENTGKWFATEPERYEAAIKDFTTVSNEHSGTTAARWAKYYVALSQVGLAKYAEAEKQLQELSGEGDADFRSVTKMALAGTLQKQSKAADAEKILKELEQNPTRTVPKVPAQLALADIYRTSNPGQARTIYQEIEKEFPESSLAEMASARILELPAQ